MWTLREDEELDSGGEKRRVEALPSDRLAGFSAEPEQSRSGKDKTGNQSHSLVEKIVGKKGLGHWIQLPSEGKKGGEGPGENTGLP